MKIEEGLAILELEPNVPNVGGTIYPTLLWDENEAVLFDAGLPGQGGTILELIRKEGILPEKIKKIIITHQDMDHIGSLAQIADTLNCGENHQGTVEVLSHEQEKPYIQGELMPIKFTPEMLEKLKKQLAELPPEHQKEVQSMFSANKPKVTDTVSHEQELPFCGGITILHIPGHTPGHICAYVKKYKTLIAGDALYVENGKLVGPDPQHSYNVEQALQSLKILLNYDIERIICYHGGLVSGNMNSEVKDLI